jgi:serine/threonine protein phosphatase PrpC
MNITATAASLTGRRQNNEDRYLVAAPLGLFAVADGMGGYAGGEVASRITVDELERFVARNRRDPTGTWPCKEDKRRTFQENLLGAAVLQAHLSIHAQREGPLDQMGSTVVSVLVEGRRAVLAHVGDSRIYLLRKGSLRQLTRDHSLWAEMEAAGMEVGPRAAFGHKNIVTRALGIDGSHRAEVATVELEPGDRLLLCSDGLHDLLEPAQLAKLMEGPCDALVQAAYNAGSSDNITAVLLSVE